MLYALISLGGILSLISVVSGYYPLKWAAGFSWLALFLYWLNADLLVDGSPADIAVMMVFLMLSILFLLWGMAGRKSRGAETIEERYTSAGKLVDRIVKSTSDKRAPVSSGRESTSEYKSRVRSALGSKASKRRKQ